MKIIIPGIPIAKSPVRIFQSGGKTLHYDKKKPEKLSVIQKIKTQIAEKGYSFDLDDFFHVELRVHRPIPVSLTTAQKNVLSYPFHQNYVEEAPDCSNYFKFYEDCGNGLLWPDDKRNVSIQTSKHYSLKPRVEIIIVKEKKQKLTESQEAVFGAMSYPEFEDLMVDMESIVNLYETCRYDFQLGEVEELTNAFSSFASKNLNILKKVAKKAYKENNE